MKRVIAILGMVLLAASFVQAELPEGTTIEDYLPEFDCGVIDWNGNQYQYGYQFGGIEEFEVEENKWKLKGEITLMDNPHGIITLQELEFDPDPSVFANQLIHNNTGSSQTYIINASQPAYLTTATSQVHGSIGITLQDANHVNGATLSDNSNPIYRAYIDGVEVDTLMDDPYTFTTGGNLTASTSAQFGWDNFGAGVSSNITILVELTLSPGDMVTVQSRFDVIPEPAALMLLGVTSSAFVFIRRRFIA